jgi:HTH-type transcriptional regulator/antitoxin HigA
MSGQIRAIRSEADYAATLARIDALMDAEPGSPEGEELDVLADLVELYEEKTVPMGYPSPLAAIQFRMEQEGLTPRDLIPFMGSRAKVSEVLSGKRSLTMQMARALHANLGIPADVLLQQPGGELPSALDGIEWDRFPLAEMAKRGWIPNRRDFPAQAEELMRGLIDRAGGEHVLPVAFYRKNDLARLNAKTDPYALKAWCWEVLARANAQRLPGKYKPGTVDQAFLREVAKLSWSEEGPKLAQEFLAKQGIHLVCLAHLPRTHLDGAALQLADGTPIIGLTLRYDRLDNFWFCLLHELAHIGRHLGKMRSEAFVDDLSLRDVKGLRRDPRENEADEWAENGLIPEDVWRTSRVKDDPSPLAVMALAQRLGIHPAIVAGRIRHETQNFRLLSHFVGTGVVRRQLFEREGLRRPRTSASCSMPRASSVSEAVTKGGGGVMAKHFPKGLDNRMRDRDGEIRQKRSDTLVGTLRKEYGDNFAQGFRSDTKLGTVLKREGVETLDQLLKKR